MQSVYTVNRRLHRLGAALGIALATAMTLAALASCSRRVTLYVAPRDDGRPGAGTRDDPYGDLARAVSGAPDKATVLLAAGHYHLAPSIYADPTCGNCNDPDSPVSATVGLLVKGKSLHIEGAGALITVIHTHAGYGILFEDSPYSGLQDLGVTDGAHDTDGNATDAAILSRRGQLALVGVRVFESLDDSETGSRATMGISAVSGREGSRLLIRNSELLGNGGDGLALFRGAQAVIEDSLIDGVDSCRGGMPCGGHDAAVRLVRDARATILNTVIRRHWSGIHLLGDADAEIHGNVIEDTEAWGIAIQDDMGRGRPGARVEDNVIYRTGACGAWISVDQGSAGGRLAGNVLIDTGAGAGIPPESGRSCGAGAAIAVEASPTGFIVENNASYGDRESPLGAEFEIVRARLCSNLASLRYGERTSFHARFCAAGASRRSPFESDG